MHNCPHFSKIIFCPWLVCFLWYVKRSLWIYLIWDVIQIHTSSRFLPQEALLTSFHLIWVVHIWRHCFLWGWVKNVGKFPYQTFNNSAFWLVDHAELVRFIPIDTINGSLHLKLKLGCKTIVDIGDGGVKN